MQIHTKWYKQWHYRYRQLWPRGWKTTSIQFLYDSLVVPARATGQNYLEASHEVLSNRWACWEPQMTKCTCILMLTIGKMQFYSSFVQYDQDTSPQWHDNWHFMAPKFHISLRPEDPDLLPHTPFSSCQNAIPPFPRQRCFHKSFLILCEIILVFVLLLVTKTALFLL